MRWQVCPLLRMAPRRPSRALGVFTCTLSWADSPWGQTAVRSPLPADQRTHFQREDKFLTHPSLFQAEQTDGLRKDLTPLPVGFYKPQWGGGGMGGRGLRARPWEGPRTRAQNPGCARGHSTPNRNGNHYDCVCCRPAWGASLTFITWFQFTNWARWMLLSHLTEEEPEAREGKWPGGRSTRTRALSLVACTLTPGTSAV